MSAGALSTGAVPTGAAATRDVRNTWTYTLGSLVFYFVVLDAVLTIFAVQAFSDSKGVAEGILLVLILLSAAVHIRYCWFLRVGSGGGLPGTAWTMVLIATAAATWALGLAMPGVGLMAAMPLWMAACLLACLVSRRRRWLLLGGGLAVVLLHLAVTGQRVEAAAGQTRVYGDPALIVYGAALPLMLLASLWWWEIVVKLDLHRRTAAELAVARERLRFASDLHDIQGHHLQVIALKSELAERLLDLDIEAARGQLHETREIAKQALEETRSLVSGYREIALDNELQNAREVLGAAGAICELDLDALPGDPAVRYALAMSVREATTNILRHSNATRASITLRVTDDYCTLSIGNNGLEEQNRSSSSRGSGLSGLRERTEALGGRLEAGINPVSGEYELTVRMPMNQGVKA